MVVFCGAIKADGYPADLRGAARCVRRRIPASSFLALQDIRWRYLENCQHVNPHGPELRR